MDRFKRRRLQDLFRSANWSELTDRDMAEAGVPQANRPDVLRRAAAIHAAYTGSDPRDALRLRDEAVAEIGDALTFEELPKSMDPRRLADRAEGRPDMDDLDDQDPRKLAEGLPIY
jgi:hypothetical protein